jgi:excisionase family DNA binding protein
MQWFFGTKEAVDYLRAIGARGASEALLRRLIQAGEIRRVRIGKKFYVKKETLDAWFARDQRKKGPPEA